jgi:RNA-directed DNA polymerase
MNASFKDSEKSINETLEGTSQGGVISPLLSSIALDGIEKQLKTAVTKLYGAKSCKSLTITRYADDIIIVHPNLADKLL